MTQEGQLTTDERPMGQRDLKTGNGDALEDLRETEK